MDRVGLKAIALGFVSALIVAWAWRILNWVWFRPRKLEKCLRKQGLNGNSYRFLVGDLNEYKELIRKARSKPISFSDNILPRALPLPYQTLKKCGKNSFIWFGPTPRLQITDPELIKQVLTKNYRFKKLKPNPILKMFTRGLATLEGETWAQHRKILNPAFHIHKLKLMLPAMYDSCTEMMRKWEIMMEEKNGWCDLDVAPYIQTLSSDVISRTAFGSSYQEGSRVFELQNQQIELVLKTLQRYLPTKNNRRMKDLTAKINSSLKVIIEKKMKAMKAGQSSTDDLLGILLESNSNEQHQHGSRKVGMTLDAVIGECKLFYFAGQETVSSLLVWALVLLSIHPAWQSRAREEVIQVFQNHGTPDFDHLNHLKIVTMILYEVLRLYPPAHMLNRKVFEETTLGDMTLPAGVEISLLIMPLHYDQEIWGNDAQEFEPERFSGGVLKATTNHQAAYFPFGWGPRICIGQNFAMLEAKLALSKILQHFWFELSPSYTHAPTTVITLQPQHGANLIIHKL